MGQPSRSKVIRVLTKAGHVQSKKNPIGSSARFTNYTEGFVVEARSGNPYARVSHMETGLSRQPDRVQAKVTEYAEVLVRAGFSVVNTGRTLEVRDR